MKRRHQPDLALLHPGATSNPSTRRPTGRGAPTLLGLLVALMTACHEPPTGPDPGRAIASTSRPSGAVTAFSTEAGQPGGSDALAGASDPLLVLEDRPRVVYDNDDVFDVYTDDYLMALASAGDIELLALSTSSSLAPFNPWVDPADMERHIGGRLAGVKRARESGMTGIPDPILGPATHLEEPPSGRIEDTRPPGSDAALRIVEEAARLAPEGELVLVMGGPLTVAAEAYLLDPSIADRVRVFWLGGRRGHTGDYNGLADPWAAYIVLERLRLVVFDQRATGVEAAPRVPKRRLERDLPDTPLREWMIGKEHPSGMPNGRDADAPPAIALMQPRFMTEVRRVSFDGWEPVRGRRVPRLREDPRGDDLLVSGADREVSTEEWWRALRNPTAYAGAGHGGEDVPVGDAPPSGGDPPPGSDATGDDEASDGGDPDGGDTSAGGNPEAGDDPDAAGDPPADDAAAPPGEAPGADDRCRSEGGEEDPQSVGPEGEAPGDPDEEAPTQPVFPDGLGPGIPYPGEGPAGPGLPTPGRSLKGTC